MSKTDTEIRAAYVAKCAQYAKEKHPGITDKQAVAIGERTASRCSIWSESMLASEQHEWLVDAEIGVDRSLVRPVPTASQVAAHLLQQHREDHGEFVSATKELEISREAAAMDADTRLAVCPASAVTAAKVEQSAVEALNASGPRTMTQTEIEDAEDRFLWRTLGLRPHEIDGHKRAEYLKNFHGTGPSHGEKMSAQLIDQLNLKSGGDTDALSTVEKMNLYRAQQALAKKKTA